MWLFVEIHVYLDCLEFLQWTDARVQAVSQVLSIPASSKPSPDQPYISHLTIGCPGSLSRCALTNSWHVEHRCHNQFQCSAYSCEPGGN